MSSNLTARESGAAARPATWADAEALSRTLANAFFDDPLLCFMLQNEATRPVMMPRFFKSVFKLGLPHGACAVTTGYEGAALWRPPNKWHVSVWRYIASAGELLSVFGLAGTARLIGALDHIEKQHPREPHWYLQAIGTDPAKQGKGYGGVLIRHELARADAEGAPCYLESSKESNIPIYASFGFEVTGEIKIPGGPTLYPMWREARAQD